MKRILLCILALSGLAATSRAMQLDLPATLFNDDMPFEWLSAQMTISVDGVAQPNTYPPTQVAGPDGFPLRYHFMFNYDDEFLPLIDEGSLVRMTRTAFTVNCPNGGPVETQTWIANRTYNDILSQPYVYTTGALVPYADCPSDSPICSVDPADLDFGTVPISTPTLETFIITNTGGGTLSGTVVADCEHFVVTWGGTFSLGAGQSQEVTLDFLSHVAGTFTCDVVVTQGCVVHCTATAEAPPSCSLDVDSLDFGESSPDVPVTRSFTITNNGGGILSGTVTEDCADFSVLSGANYSLGAGLSQLVTVQMLAEDLGEPTCDLNVGEACGNVSCSGEILPGPVCVVDPLELDFGTVLPGVPVNRSFTITNLGGGTLSGTVSMECEAVFTILSGATYSLAGGQSQTVQLQFLGTTPSQYQCIVVTGGTCSTVTLAGTIEAAPACAVDPIALDFGLAQPDQVVTRTFTITNTGGGTLSGTVVDACESFTVTAGADYSLGAGQSQTVTVQMQGTVPGNLACVLDTGGSCADVTCSGAVDQPPTCAVDPLVLDFGTTIPDAPVSRTFTITNTGGGTLSGSVAETCEAFSVSNGVYNLTAGQQQIVTVTLLTSTVGDHNCLVDAGGSCADVTCAGVVQLAPACAVDPVNLDFGVALPGTPVSQTFTITNTGGGTLSGSVTESCLEFSVVNGDYSLTNGQSQVVTVTFLSNVPNAYFCELDTGGSCTDVACTGTAELAPACSVAPLTLDFGTVLPGTAVTRTFTITNTGGGTLAGSVSESCEAFIIVSGADYSLGAGLSQTVTVQMQHEVPGSLECVIDTGGPCATDVVAGGGVLDVAVTSGPDSDCGTVENLGHLPGATSGFLVDYYGGLVGLRMEPDPAANVSIAVKIDGVTTWSGPATAAWEADDFQELWSLIDEDIVLHFEVSDGVNTWNQAGATCLWDLGFLAIGEQLAPTAFLLHEPAPNPFNPVTHLQLELPGPDHVLLRVVDLNGRIVATLFNGDLPAGIHDFSWQPDGVASGTYFVVAKGNQDYKVKGMLYLR